MSLSPFGAIVLAGGRASRLGGVHKPALDLGGTTLLARVCAAAAEAVELVVVGPPQEVPPGARLVRESPAGGGPVAALAAGLAVATAEQVALLAADLPFLTASALTALRRAAVDRDGAVLTDESERDQYLAGVWTTDRLRAALTELGDPGGLPMRRLMARLDYARVAVPGEPNGPAPWFDCDDADDLTAAQRWVTPE
jgi:molybdopterin-guanine dinucleotide biosynthesis protein A